MKTPTPAHELNRGDTFVVAKQECFVIYVGQNDFDQMVIRFVTDTSKDPMTSTMVVPDSFKFNVKK